MFNRYYKNKDLICVNVCQQKKSTVQGELGWVVEDVLYINVMFLLAIASQCLLLGGMPTTATATATTTTTTTVRFLTDAQIV